MPGTRVWAGLPGLNTVRNVFPFALTWTITSDSTEGGGGNNLVQMVFVNESIASKKSAVLARGADRDGE